MHWPAQTLYLDNPHPTMQARCEVAFKPAACLLSNALSPRHSTPSLMHTFPSPSSPPPPPLPTSSIAAIIRRILEFLHAEDIEPAIVTCDALPLLVAAFSESLKDKPRVRKGGGGGVLRECCV